MEDLPRKRNQIRGERRKTFLVSQQENKRFRSKVSSTSNSESLKLKDSDGLLPGGDFIKSSSSPIKARTRRRNSSESREPLRESPLTTSKRSKLPAPKTRRPLLRKPSVRSRREREPSLPRRTLIRRLSIRTRTFNRKLKTKLPKKPKRKQHPPRIKNDRPLI